jgi:predicted nucleic-acid-binding Zn-ribbon protein
MKDISKKIYWTVVQLILLITLIQLFSCSTGSCFDETESQVKATFYRNDTGSPQGPDSVTIYGISMDTMKIYDNIAGLKSAEFPLYGDDTRREFVLMINGINDTLTFEYISYIHLLSKECGYTYFYTLDTVLFSGTVIKSVTMEKKTITTFNEENLRIYY